MASSRRWWWSTTRGTTSSWPSKSPTTKERQTRTSPTTTQSSKRRSNRSWTRRRYLTATDVQVCNCFPLPGICRRHTPDIFPTHVVNPLPNPRKSKGAIRRLSSKVAQRTSFEESILAQHTGQLAYDSLATLLVNALGAQRTCLWLCRISSIQRSNKYVKRCHGQPVRTPHYRARTCRCGIVLVKITPRRT